MNCYNSNDNYYFTSVQFNYEMHCSAKETTCFRELKKICAGLHKRVKQKAVNKLHNRHVKDKPPKTKQSNLVYGPEYTALPRQKKKKKKSDIAHLRVFQLYHLHTKYEFEYTTNEPYKQRMIIDDNIVINVCPLPRLTEFQCRPLVLNFGSYQVPVGESK